MIMMLLSGQMSPFDMIEILFCRCKDLLKLFAQLFCGFYGSCYLLTPIHIRDKHLTLDNDFLQTLK